MARYLIDVNLPYYFSVWRGPDHERISGIWNDVCELSAQYRLVNVFRDRIEGID
ncbi:MAG: hypothetical protein ACJ76Y_06395 [Thermoanaerobaculia bacterium]